jgi:hypothetical protein
MIADDIFANTYIDDNEETTTSDYSVMWKRLKFKQEDNNDYNENVKNIINKNETTKNKYFYNNERIEKKEKKKCIYCKKRVRNLTYHSCSYKKYFNRKSYSTCECTSKLFINQRKHHINCELNSIKFSTRKCLKCKNDIVINHDKNKLSIHFNYENEYVIDKKRIKMKKYNNLLKMFIRSQNYNDKIIILNKIKRKMELRGIIVTPSIENEIFSHNCKKKRKVKNIKNDENSSEKCPYCLIMYQKKYIKKHIIYYCDSLMIGYLKRIYQNEINNEKSKEINMIFNEINELEKSKSNLQLFCEIISKKSKEKSNFLQNIFKNRISIYFNHLIFVMGNRLPSNWENVKTNYIKFKLNQIAKKYDDEINKRLERKIKSMKRSDLLMNPVLYFGVDRRDITKFIDFHDIFLRRLRSKLMYDAKNEEEREKLFNVKKSIEDYRKEAFKVYDEKVIYFFKDYN